MPRGRIRLARLLMNYGPRHELMYRDQWGYKRVAILSDELEARGFVGAHFLPNEVAQRVRPGDWVIDVGANVGLLTAHLCHLTGSRGRVWAIEPVPRNAFRLNQLKKLNRLNYLKIYQGALSSSSGNTSLRLPVGRQSGYASFTKSWDMSGTIDVTTWRLDDLTYEENYGQPVAFIKIDVEGHEPQVLKGGERTLREMNPLVFCEFNDILLQDAGSSSVQLLEQFARLGYSPLSTLPELTGRVVDLLMAGQHDRYRIRAPGW